jgi:hypothetical protein
MVGIEGNWRESMALCEHDERVSGAGGKRYVHTCLVRFGGMGWPSAVQRKREECVCVEQGGMRHAHARLVGFWGLGVQSPLYVTCMCICCMAIRCYVRPLGDEELRGVEICDLDSKGRRTSGCGDL